MGICSSCLGLDRRASDSDPSDTSQLLGDSYQPGYGSVAANPQHNGHQPDPEEIRRQRDVLERICAQTSDKLIDVSQSAHAEDGSKMTSEYSRLFAERFPARNTARKSSSGSRPASSESTEAQDQATWLANALGDDDEDNPHWDRVRPLESGALTIQFDDVLSGNGNGNGKAAQVGKS